MMTKEKTKSIAEIADIYEEMMSEYEKEQKKEEIWVPGKQAQKPELSEQEKSKKQQELLNKILSKLLDSAKCEISDLIIEEESGHIKSTIVHEVIGPMGAAQSYLKYIKIGTPFSRGHFYDAMMSNRYKIHKYTWKEGVRNGLMKQEFIDEQMDQLTHMQFQTEYCAEFISDVDSYFSYDLIQSCIEEYPLIVL